MNAKITKDRRKETGWVKGTVGKYDECTFEAKVYSLGSSYGISDSVVSKLTITPGPKATLANCIFNHDRGLDIYECPMAVVDAVLALFPTPVCPDCGSAFIRERSEIDGGGWFCDECQGTFDKPEQETKTIGFHPDGSYADDAAEAQRQERVAYSEQA